MIRRTQNKVAESRMLLPVASAYGLLVWLLVGMLHPYYPLASKGIAGGAWVQLACMALSVVLMVFLNNSNSLIRIYSRMVSASFIVLTCVSCFQFNSIDGAIVGLCVIASCLTLFRSFQDKRAAGWIFYSFLCLGLASSVFVQILYFVPVIWLLMQVQLNSLSWRTLLASLLGLALPYWLALGWFLLQGDLSYFPAHFLPLAQFAAPDYSLLTLNQLLTAGFVLLLALTGIIHFWRQSYQDKIRTRQLYGCFIIMTFVETIALVLLPQYYDELLRLLIISTSPLIAHFIALTATRVTNIAFKVVCICALLLTALNLWMPTLRY